MEDNQLMLQELIDRQRIWDCLLRYTRGVDRLDRELMLAAFHPEARIEQAGFKGNREDLADWVLGYHRDNQLLTQHIMTNHFCEIDGDEAHTETYVAYYGTNPEVKDAFVVGRYIDRLQRYADGWLISDRVTTTEGTTDFNKNGLLEQFTPPVGALCRATRDTTDPAYQRPLCIKPTDMP